MTTAESEVCDIDGWRNDPIEKAYISPWEEPRHFWADTPIVAGELQRHRLSAQPLLDVYHAVCLWHETHSADDLPEQSTLRANLEQSRALLQTLRGELLASAIEFTKTTKPKAGWAKVLNCDVRTLDKSIEAGTVVLKPFSDRKYHIRLSDVAGTNIK